MELCNPYILVCKGYTLFCRDCLVNLCLQRIKRKDAH
nr:MAG TPA: Protein of unknown function (DUF1244) [Caudoviricetes sp.]